MTVPFGFSLGDFIAGIRLVKEAVGAFSDTHGARTDYNELQKSLADLLRAFEQVTPYATQQHQDALKDIIDACKNSITVFLISIAKFDLLKDGAASPDRLRTGLRKIRWALCKKDDVDKFSKQLSRHVDALQLQITIFQISEQFQTRKVVDESKLAVEDLTKQMATGLKLQNDHAEIMIREQTGQSCSIAKIETEVHAYHQLMTSVPHDLTEMRKQLQSGLSPDMQHAMFRMLEEALKRAAETKQKLEEIVLHNQILQANMAEIKIMMQVQQDIPAQVMLRRPVILIDPFEDNRLPFHLEFINSFEALVAVLMVRFKDRGVAALERIRQWQFNIYETNKQTRIDVCGPWVKAFKPGQITEMSMLISSQAESLEEMHCPGCYHKEVVHGSQNKKIQCRMCPMAYRWSPKSLESSEPTTEQTRQGSPALNMGAEVNEVTEYIRVDVIAFRQSRPVLPQAGLLLSDARSFVVRFCCSCGDGPFGLWQTLCSHKSCGHIFCQGCTIEAPPIENQASIFQDA